jgi:hypothetical protein
MDEITKRTLKSTAKFHALSPQTVGLIDEEGQSKRSHR